MKNFRGKKILDAGFGSGVYSFSLAEKAGKIEVVDISKEKVAHLAAAIFEVQEMKGIYRFHYEFWRQESENSRGTILNSWLPPKKDPTQLN